MKKSLVLVFSSLFLLSCSDMEMVVELDIPAHEPVLVLNGMLDTDTNVHVMLSSSLGAFEQGNLSNVTGVQVALYEDEIFVDSLFLDNSNPTDYEQNLNDDFNGNSETIRLFSYHSDFRPQSGSTYRIEASHPNYPSILARTYIPQDIALFNVQIDSLSNQDYLLISFSFNDNPSQANFYRIRALGDCSKNWMNEYGEDEEFFFEGQIQLNSNDPSLASEGIPFEGYTFSNEEALFTDALFDGQQKNMSFDIETDFFKWGDCDTVVLQFTVFSDDSYLYFNSLEAHSSNGRLGIFGGEVVPVYSNVENGLGVVISANAQTLFLKP